ncbi:hypothetical protein LXL04_006936 [Taraxacum kok-saghyz]
MIPVRNLAGSLNLSSVLGGIQWVNVRFNRGFSGTWIQSGLQWNLARMNQTEIDELLRDEHEHGYTEIVGSPDSGGCASLILVDGESEG